MEPPTEAEVAAVIKTRKSDKAAGLDSLPPEFFKTANSTLTPWIITTLAKIWERGFAPAAWQECALVPVHKKEHEEVCH